MKNHCSRYSKKCLLTVEWAKCIPHPLPLPRTFCKNVLWLVVWTTCMLDTGLVKSKCFVRKDSCPELEPDLALKHRPPSHCKWSRVFQEWAGRGRQRRPWWMLIGAATAHTVGVTGNHQAQKARKGTVAGPYIYISFHHVDMNAVWQKITHSKQHEMFLRVAQPLCLPECKDTWRQKHIWPNYLLSYTCTTTNDFNGSCP